ncbi:MAG TPA: hypothetical protein VGI86_07210, partial [Acidimicrobiia bacterium]
ARSWRWWDGRQWSVAEHAFHPEHRRQLREQARRAGRWARAALVASAVLGVFNSGLTSAVLTSTHGALFFTRNSDGIIEKSHRITTLQHALLIPGVFSIAVIGIEIWWLVRIGEFAQASGWPSTHNRTLGAWSLIIPVVSLWFPYLAIRDSNPPGHPNDDLLRWWLWRVIAPPVIQLGVFAAAATDNAVFVALALGVATVVLILIAVLGWHVVDEIDHTQDSALAAT